MSWALLLLCLAHAALTGWLALARYAALHNRTFDLALYTRIAWGMAHGELWEPIFGGSVLGGHMSIALLPLGLLGRVFGTVPVLLGAQSLCVALAALPIAALATRHLGRAAGLCAALAWLLYPNLGHVTTYEFHPGTLAVLPLCCAFDALDRQAPRALLWCCLAVVLCRASLALTTLMLGILAMRGAPALRRPGQWIAAASLAYSVLAVTALTRSHDVATVSAGAHFGIWGGSPFGVFVALLRDPALVVQHFATPSRLVYPLLVLAPVLFLPILRPRYLLVALPTLAQNLLSDFPTTTSLYSHYLTPAVPALVVAALDGLVRLTTAAPKRQALAAAALVLSAAAGSALAGGLPWSRDFRVADITYDRNSAAARAVLARIPVDASVQAPDALLPHMAERKRFHRAPPPERGTQFVVLDTSHRRRFAHREDLLRTIEEPLTRRWLARPDHGLLVAQRDLLLLRRGSSPRAGLAKRYLVGTAPAVSGATLTRCLAVRTATLERRSVSLELVARAPCSEDLALRIGAEKKPPRVDLLFDGLLSPAQLLRGDLLRSRHRLSDAERSAIAKHGLRIGVLRSSGAAPEPGDPIAVTVPLRHLGAQRGAPGASAVGTTRAASSSTKGTVK